MISRVRYRVGVLLAACGAALWGVGLAVVTPAADAAEKTNTLFAEYEVHDAAQYMRWASIVLLVVGVVLAGGNRPQRVGGAAVGVGVLVAVADTALDIYDVAGVPAAAGAAVAAAVIAVVAATLTRARDDDAPGGAPAPRLFAAAVAACAAPSLASTIEEPDLAALVPTSLIALVAIVQALLAVAAMACALAAAGSVSRQRLAFAAVVGGLAAAVLVIPQTYLADVRGAAMAADLMLGGVLVVAVVAVAAGRRPVTRRRALGWFGGGLAAALAMPVALVVGEILLAAPVSVYFNSTGEGGSVDSGLPLVLAAVPVGVAAAMIARRASGRGWVPAGAVPPAGMAT